MNGHVTEHVGVAVDEFSANAVRHIVQVEAAGVVLDVGVEHHLEQNISQFLLQMFRGALVNGLRHLIGLLQKVAPDGLVGLLHIPGTTAGMA